MMQLKQLLKDIPDCQVKGSTGVWMTGMSADSKRIVPGNIFIAKKGKMFDGRNYIPEAIQRGASAIVTDLFDPILTQVVQVIHPAVSSIESVLAVNYYQRPSQELFMVGITGTNGKTTTSFIVKHLLDSLIAPCGLIGTIEYIVGQHRRPATHTTPDVISNHHLLREMIVEGCSSAVMEVTSHALDQGRVDKIEFDIAIFSNLTLDHLDYHRSMEHYANAKKTLFQRLGKEKSEKKTAKWAIVNQDSPWTPYMLQESTAQIISYGIDNPADLQASSVRLEAKGTGAKVTYQGRSLDAYWPLSGRFNVYNCLASIGVALSQQIPLEEILCHLSSIPPIRGRLQPVNNRLGLQIYVDFAHSDDALCNILATLKEIKQPSGCLIVVFGCGGDRDRSKRPKMAEACERYAELSIVTSDNPRSEDPHRICDEIICGFSRKSVYEVEVNRRAAIRKAMEYAKVEDIILIAGRGHERGQVFADRTIEFDDCQVAAEICAELSLHSSGIAAGLSERSEERDDV